MTQRRDAVKLHLALCVLRKKFSDCKRASTPSVRTNLRFILGSSDICSDEKIVQHI